VLLQCSCDANGDDDDDDDILTPRSCNSRKVTEIKPGLIIYVKMCKCAQFYKEPMKNV